MRAPGHHRHAYALKPDEGWIYRFGIDFQIKAGEVREGSGAAFVEYVTRKGEEPRGIFIQPKMKCFM